MKKSAPSPARPGMKKKATLKDIAELCGVSPMAVSMAINHKEGVSEKTAEKIWKAIRKLNYTPNLVAKSLRVSSTKTIGVLMSDSSQFLFTRLLKTISDEAEAAGYSIIMANTDQNPERERRAVDVLLNKRIDGLLLAAPLLADDAKVLDALNFGMPMVMAMRNSGFEIDSVCTDNYNGAYAMVDYLARTGSKKIHMINLSQESQSGVDRLRGYKQALADNGLTPPSRTVPHVKPQIADGREAMRKLLARGVKSGAVFCGCDLIAIGAIQEILSHGLSIPGDFRIAGFDDIEMLEHLSVPLTTMRQPVEEMARISLSLLFERIKNPGKPTSRVLLPSQRIVRQST